MDTMNTQIFNSVPHLGFLYDTVSFYLTRADIEFYVREVNGVTVPVLEVGCSTGRVLLPGSRAETATVGLDNSMSMLTQCKAMLSHESEETQTRFTLYYADACDLNVMCSLVIIPFRVFQHLTTIDEQLKWHMNIARHLTPKGRLIFNFLILISLRWRRITIRKSRVSLRFPFRRTVSSEDDANTTYPMDRAGDRDKVNLLSNRTLGSPPKHYVQAFDMGWYRHAQIKNLLAHIGFQVQAILGDFDGSARTNFSPEQIVVAEGA